MCTKGHRGLSTAGFRVIHRAGDTQSVCVLTLKKRLFGEIGRSFRSILNLRFKECVIWKSLHLESFVWGRFCHFWGFYKRRQLISIFSSAIMDDIWNLHKQLLWQHSWLEKWKYSPNDLGKTLRERLNQLTTLNAAVQDVQFMFQVVVQLLQHSSCSH